MRERRLLGRSLLVLAMAGLLALAATVATAQSRSATPANGRAGSKLVSVSGSAWSPSSLTVTRGGRVTWKNPTSVTHDVVAYGGKWSFSRSLSSGQSVSYVFSNAGTFLFRCALHSYVSGGVCYGMCGRVIVQK
jgi:plastocyanin